MVRTAPFQWTPSKPPSHCALGHESRGMGDAQHYQMSLHGRVGSDWQLSVNAIHSVCIGPKVRIDQSSPLSKYASPSVLPVYSRTTCRGRSLCPLQCEHDGWARPHECNLFCIIVTELRISLKIATCAAYNIPPFLLLRVEFSVFQVHSSKLVHSHYFSLPRSAA